MLLAMPPMPLNILDNQLPSSSVVGGFSLSWSPAPVSSGVAGKKVYLNQKHKVY